MGPALSRMLGAFTAAMTAAMALFWAAALIGDGPRALLAGLDPGLVAIGTLLHLPAMAASILLWRAGAARARPTLRWGLFLAMVYFSAACIISVFGNFLAATILNQIA